MLEKDIATINNVIELFKGKNLDEWYLQAHALRGFVDYHLIIINC